jgi:putative transposase
MIFTMKYSHHPNRKTTFTKAVETSGRFHALIPKGKPWRNGFIERSNRTDNDELFHRFKFTSSEERKYYLKLWEYEYNFNRPHQSLDHQTPAQVFYQNYPIYRYFKLQQP